MAEPTISKTSSASDLQDERLIAAESGPLALLRGFWAGSRAVTSAACPWSSA